MCAKRSSSDSRPNKPIPVIPAPASVVPNQFREIPIDDDRINAAKREAVRSMGLSAGRGEDPTGESGMPAYEPVSPRKTPESES